VVILIALVAALASSGLTPADELRATFIFVVPALFSLFLVWGFTRASPSTVIDFGKRRICSGVGDTPFGRAREFSLRTSLQMYYVRRGGMFGSSGQLWSLFLASDDALSMPIASHTSEYVLLRAARRLAVAIGVPLLDYAGVPGTAAEWRPGVGTVGVGPAAEVTMEWRSSGVQMTLAAPGGGDAPVPQTTVKRRDGANGVTLDWGGTRRLDLLVVFAALAVALAGPWLWRDAHWSRWGLLVVSIVLLVAAFRRAAEAAVEGITVRADALVTRGRFPFVWRRRLPLRNIEDVRASAVLLFDVRILGDVAKERVALVRLDVLGRRGPLLRLWARPADGGALLAEIREALGARLPSREAEGR
jgi:hypothetical protein